MKKLLKKLGVIAMAAMMVMAMGVTALAAAPAGTYQTSLQTSTGATPRHNNPLPGVAIGEYDETDNVTEVVVYADPINYMGVTGYVTDLTLDGVYANESSYGTVTDEDGNPVYEDGELVEYENVMRFEVPGEITAPCTFSITYQVEYVGLDNAHNSSSGYLIVYSELNE